MSKHTERWFIKRTGKIIKRKIRKDEFKKTGLKFINIYIADKHDAKYLFLSQNKLNPKYYE
jgi:hypothetical protein